jgi:hypothetical protein
MGRNSTQRPTHSDAWASPWPRHGGAHGPQAEPAHGMCGPSAGTARDAQVRTEAVTALRARVMARSATALPWLRWGAQASTVEGSPAGQVDASGSSPELLDNGKGKKTETAAAFSDDVGAPVACVVLRWGGKEEGAQAQVYLEKKAVRGARGSTHCGVSRDGGGGRSSDDRAAPPGELLHRWGEGGEGR